MSWLRSTQAANKRVQCVKMACATLIQQAVWSARYVMEMKTMEDETKQIQLLNYMKRQAVALEMIVDILHKWRHDG